MPGLLPHERHMLVVSVSLKLDNLAGQLYYFAKVNVGNCNLVSTSFPPERLIYMTSQPCSQLTLSLSLTHRGCGRGFLIEATF